VKAQVQAGGRGKGHLTSGMKGGVHVVDTPDIVKEKTEGMIGYNLITHQTTAAGLPVSSVLVHEAVDIDRQIYLAFLHDRKNQQLCCVYSKKGGMDIEAVAEEDPEAIKTISFPLKEELSQADAVRIVDDLELTGKTREQGIEQL
jgi:succinyl-CoA synthetase beta subunit